MNENKYLERPRIDELLDRGAKCKITYLCADTGWGKSVAVELWVKKQRFAVRLFSTEERRPSGVLDELGKLIPMENERLMIGIDNFHLLIGTPVFGECIEFIKRSASQWNFLILSQCYVPDELKPYADIYQLEIISQDSLCFDESEIKDYYEKNGFPLDPYAYLKIRRSTHGWALALNTSLFAIKESGRIFNKEVMLNANEKLFRHFDRTLFDGWTPRTQELLMKLSIMITETGENTEFGEIADQLRLRPPETEFERGVRRFGYLLTIMMLILTLTVFAINVIFKRPAIDSLLFSVALAVGITPQLLPAIISITLSKGSRNMAKEGVIVRRLTAIENFGSMDILCTDKTGTLTEGLIRLDGDFDVEGQASESVFRLSYLNASLQSGMANSLDDAIIGTRDIDISSVTKRGELPFDFTRERLSVIVEDNNQYIMIAKGALSSILDICSNAQIEGDVKAIDTTILDGIHERYAEWSNEGIRVLGVAQTISELARIGVDLRIIIGDNKLIALHVANAVGLKVDVAKESADFVLIEKSLKVLTRGIELGRTTFSNTLKYILITTSANFGNMFSMAGASLFMPFLPLLPKQILLLNFLTDFPAIIIANDAVDAELLEKPRRWDIRFIRDFMFTFGLISSAFDYITFAVLLIVFKAQEELFQSSWFALSILTELLILMVMRTQQPFFKSKPAPMLLYATIGVGVFTFIIPYLPLHEFINIEPINPLILASLIGIAILYIIVTEIAKHYFYKFKSHSKGSRPK